MRTFFFLMKNSVKLYLYIFTNEKLNPKAIVIYLREALFFCCLFVLEVKAWFRRLIVQCFISFVICQGTYSLALFSFSFQSSHSTITRGEPGFVSRYSLFLYSSHCFWQRERESVGRRGGALEPRGTATHGIGAHSLTVVWIKPWFPLLSLEPRLTPSRHSFFVSLSSISIRLLKPSSFELGRLHLAWLLKGTVQQFN